MMAFNNINVDLTITVHEAKNGGVRRVNVLHTECCPVCKGKKFVNGAKCKKCKGWICQAQRIYKE